MESILNEHAKKTPKPFHGAALTAIDAMGNTLLSSCNGTTTVDPNGPVLSEDSVFWIASGTKIFTAVAAMIVVERGLIGLDDEVGVFVHELADPYILEGFKEDGDSLGEPILRKARKKITLRHLLCHTSGFVYVAMKENLQRWTEYKGRDINSLVGSYEGFVQPLLFEPGESCLYGPGIDWAGKVVETVSNQTLEQFMQSNIWQPLGMTSTTFDPRKVSSYQDRKVETSTRTDSGDLVRIDTPYPLAARDNLGGMGLYSTPKEFTAFLAALLAGGSDIITAESIDEIFRPQLPEVAKAILNADFSKPGSERMGRILTPGRVVDFGLSVCVNMEDVDGRRFKGAVSWVGHPSIYWWIDRKAGVCATVFLQHVPPVDEYAIQLLEDFEAALYRTIQRK